MKKRVAVYIPEIINHARVEAFDDGSMEVVSGYQKSREFRRPWTGMPSELGRKLTAVEAISCGTPLGEEVH